MILCVLFRTAERIKQQSLIKRLWQQDKIDIGEFGLIS